MNLLSRGQRRRAQILGRAILLGYRFSGGVPDVLAGSRLSIGDECIRLEVSRAARVPDSEVVAGRMKLLAAAVGAKRFEVTEFEQ
jgi:exopolyphosphatase/guanosine-5'-triphosphate,3'-diphosphate pyrophosphatase